MKLLTKISVLLFFSLIVNTNIKAQLSVKASVDHLQNDGVDTLGNITLTVSGSTAPYTYTWMPGNVSTKDITNIKAGSYTVTVKSASNETYTATYNLKYKTDWTNLDRCYFRNDSLVSTSSNVYCRAVSKNTLTANTDGWFEYVLDVLPSNAYFIGFLDSISPNLSTYTDIDYGFYYYPTKVLEYWENGSYNTLTNSPKVGDVVRIERIGNVINYKINGATVRTLTVSGISSKNLKLKAVLVNSNRVVNVGCSFNQNGNMVFPNMVNVTPLIKHLSSTGSNDGSIKVTPEISGSYTYTWQPGGANTSSVISLALGQYKVSVEDANHNISNKYYNIGYKVDWTNLDRCYFRNDSLVSTSSNVYSRAVSKNTLMANTDGWFEFVLESIPNSSFFVGFTDSISPNLATYTDIDYGFYYYPLSGTNMYAWENTTYFLGTPGIGNVYRLERTGNTITYLVNGVVTRTVSVSGISQKNLKLKAVLYNGNRLNYLSCSFNQSGNVVFPNMVNVVPLITHLSSTGSNNGSIKVTPEVSGSYTYTWQPGGANTSTISSLAQGQYKLSVEDANHNISNKYYNVGYKVDWTNLDRCYFRNDSLVSNSTDYSRAISKNTLPSSTDGWFEYVIDDLPDNYYYFGFLDSISPNLSTYTDIDFGFYMYNFTGLNKTLYALENGTATYIGTPKIGDIYRVERIGSTINYKINNVIVRTITISGLGAKSLKLKAVLVNSKRLINVACSFIQDGNTTFSNYLSVIPTIKHSSGTNINNGSIKVVPDISATYSYTWQPDNISSDQVSNKNVGLVSLSIENDSHYISKKYYNIGYKTNWKCLDKCYTRNDTLFSTSGSGSIYCNAVSSNTLSPNTDGWFEFVLSELPNNYYLIGLLDSVYSGTSIVNDIDFGFEYSYLDKCLYSWENSSWSKIAVLKIGDVLRLERVGNIINYKLNNVIVRTTTNSSISSKKLMIKAAMSNVIKLANVGCSFLPFSVPVNTPSLLTCSSPTAVISASTSVTGVTYSWVGPTPGTAAGTTPNSYSTAVNSAGVYTVTVTNPTTSVSVLAAVSVTANNNLPNISVCSAKIMLCSDTTTLINGGSTTSGVTYSWSPGGTTPNNDTTIVNATGTYTLSVTDGNGCTNHAIVKVLEVGAPYVIAEKTLKAENYALACNKLYFKIDGEYDQTTLSYKIYKYDHTLLTGLSINSSVLNHGDNRYEIDLSAISSDNYILEVINQYNEKRYLRFSK